MEVKEKSKKRELIKTIAIIFLAVLLVLTFFSNTIMNRSLPEVSTQSISSGTINAKIRGSGTVSANESYEVIINQTREVRSVCVKVGDTVEQGDLLFVLGDVESQELKDAQEQLQTLNINYQKQLLNLSKEYAAEDRSIQALQEDLQKATEQRDANQVTEAEISYAKGDLAAAKTELSQIGLVLEELNDIMADNEEYTAAKAAVEKLTAQIETVKTEIEELNKKITESGTTSDINKLLQDVNDKNAAVDAAQKELEAASKVVETTNGNLTYKQNVSEYVQLVAAAKQKMIAANVDVTDEAKLKAYIQNVLSNDLTTSEYQNAYNAVENAQRDYTNALQTYETATTKYNGAMSAYNQAKELYEAATSGNNVIATLQQQVNQKSYELSSLTSQLQQANYALSQAENSNTTLKNQIKDYEAAQRQQNALIETLNQTVTDLEAKKTAYDAAVATIEEKEQALEDALSGKDIDKQLDNLDLQTMRLQIEKQQELVDKYTEEAVDTEIKANVSGTVSAINVSAGKDTIAGSAMAVIDVVDRGYTIKIAVTNEQAKQVKVGDTADVTNYYWGNDVTATLEAIAANPDKPGQGKLLVFRVTGDIDAGTNISLSIGQKSANYDTIIPKSALREDTNGSFVLVVMAKSSPLGNRYYATRVDVQVLAEDDTNAAVSGLSAGDYVITTSSKPLEPGTMVRMVENP